MSIIREHVVSAMPHLFNIVRGEVDGFLIMDAYGHNEAVGGTLETVYQGSNRYTFLTAAEQLDVVSGSADDDVGGTGATEVTLYGLDANYAPISEAVALNGVAAVTTSASFLRINRAEVTAAGTGRTNAGLIQIQTAATTIEYIGAGEGNSHTAIYTIPAGYTGYIVEWYGFETSNKATELFLTLHLEGEVVHLVHGALINDSSFHLPLQVPIEAPARSDIEVLARSESLGANVMAGFDGWYE